MIYYTAVFTGTAVKMNMYHMREFITLADCLSYTETARKLHMSQPALTLHVHSICLDIHSKFIPNDERFVFVPIKKERLYALVMPNHPLAAKNHVPLELLSKQRIVFMRMDKRHEAHVGTLLKYHDCPAHVNSRKNRHSRRELESGDGDMDGRRDRHGLGRRFSHGRAERNIRYNAQELDIFDTVRLRDGAFVAFLL
jgi:DNA-binding transcriptional LysR family regulator